MIVLSAPVKNEEQVLHALTVPVIVLNKDLRVSWLNNTAKAMVDDDYLGKTSEEVMAFEAVEASHNALSIAAANLEPASAEVVVHPKGIIHEISYTAIPFTDEHGKLSTIVQVITDLTEIKSAQRTIIEIAGEAQAISNRVASSSLQLAKQVGDVSRGAEIQRERATATATAMEEMNTTVLEVARNAGEASQQAEVVQIRAGEGTELVSQVVNAIMQVNVMASELESTMQELGEQAENIGSVMNVISDIADQTNLLALNAAIEAARAGEAGRGFAVVADEVRKLAEKTMSATVEVGASIQGIQDAAQRNMQRVGEAIVDVARATELASVSGEALADILALVNANALLISSIAAAAEEQSVAAEEINSAVEDINMIAIETAEGTEQSSVAVQDVTQMAEDLRELLARLQHREDAA